MHKNRDSPPADEEAVERWRRIENAVDALDGEEHLTEDNGEALLAKPIEQRFRALLDAAVDSHSGGLGAGDRVGAFQIERWLGEGGMGAVYLGHRADGSFEQAVAVKILHRIPRGGPTASQAMQRFLQERQILAGLKHPHIARLLDGGLLEGAQHENSPLAGAPYLVMELVDGEPMTDYCRRHQLGLEARIRLVLQVCDALRHAHREGIVHRDVKPSNLLVETGAHDEERVVVLDFGIARVESAPLGATVTGQIFGTPGYMSPEQSLGRRTVDRRSDVFSLGVVLYELVCDAKPFAADDPAEVLRLVLEDRPTPARRHRPELAADLETILETCLRTSPSQRYDSMRSLSEDLESFLDGVPIRARREGPWSRLRRWSKKSPRVAALTFAALGLALLSLLAALVTAVSYTRAIDAERIEALEARRDAEQLIDFMLRDLHRELDLLGRLDLLEEVARHSLDYYARRAPSRGEQEGFGRSLALENSGLVLGEQGDFDGALEAFSRSRDQFEALLAENQEPRVKLGLSRSHRLLADAHSSRGDLAAALENAERATALSQELAPGAGLPTWPKIHWENLALLGWIQRETGDYAGAHRSLEAARSIAARLRDAAASSGEKDLSDDPSAGLDWRHKHAVSLSYLGVLQQDSGDLDAALENFQQALAECAPSVATDPDNTARRAELQLIHSRIGWTHLDRGEPEQALSPFRSAVEQGKVLVSLEPTHAGWLRELAVAHSGLAQAYRSSDQLAQALEGMEDSLELSRQLVARAPSNPSAVHDLAWDLLEIGRLHRELGAQDSAVLAFEEAALKLGTLRQKAQASSGGDDTADESLDDFFLDNYLLNTEVQALLELGRVEQARPLAARFPESHWQDDRLRTLAAKYGLGPGSPAP